MDVMVLAVQQWLVTTYGGNSKFKAVFPNSIAQDGVTGTQVETALVTALQIELGISTPNGTFGPATASAFTTMQIRISGTQNNPPTNKEYILQGGFWCKGYDSGIFNGIFYTDTQVAVEQFQSDAGLTTLDGKVTATIMKALLNTDPFKLAYGKDPQIRSIQQNLNSKYNAYTGLLPTNGVFVAQTSKALIYALQAEEGLSTSVANGSFGPTTRNCCPNIPYDSVAKNYSGQTYSAATITNMTKLIQYLLYCNGWNGEIGSTYDPGSFAGTFTSGTVTALKAFQKFVGLSQTGTVTINEWMALMVSTGNPDRAGKSIDCATRLTPEKIAALVDAGYSTVGRYLTGDIVVSNTRVAKNLLRPEIKDITDAGLSLFVIFQDSRQYYHDNPSETSIVDYFSEQRGHDDAEKAFSAAKSLGVPRGEFIFFAVDYDFMESQVNSMIIPYFKGLNEYANSVGNLFKIGIYSARNTCTLVREAGYTDSSFISDLSTGYSGNLGFALPEDWAFDQIQTLTQASTDGSFGVDKDVISGRYGGFSDFEKTHDDEWDNISKNGYAEVFMNGHGVTEIPLYWAKVKNADGKYAVKYDMFDSIPLYAFFSLRTVNGDNRDDVMNDNIRYVYFRDVGGRLNAGYIDLSILGPDTDVLSMFVNCLVQRNRNGTNASIIAGDSTSELFLLTQPLTEFRAGNDGPYYTYKDLKIDTLPAGTVVRIPSDAATGASYPNLLQAVEKMLPGSTEWKYIDEGWDKPGYIDMGFEFGVLPADRAIITGYLD